MILKIIYLQKSLIGRIKFGRIKYKVYRILPIYNLYINIEFWKNEIMKVSKKYWYKICRIKKNEKILESIQHLYKYIYII